MKGCAGAVLCCWPDVRVMDKSKIFSQSPVWPAVVALSELTWSGPVADYAAFERRMMVHRDQYFKGLSFAYIPEARHSWKLVNTGKIYRGSSFVLHETWPINFQLKKDIGTVAEFRTFADIPKEGLYHFCVGFDSPFRSQHLGLGIPKQGQLDASGGSVTIGGIPLTPPHYQLPGKFRYPYYTWFRPENEIPSVDEQFWWLREPATITLKPGRHEIVFKAPFMMGAAAWTPVLLPVRWNGERWVDNEIITFTAK